MGFFSGIMDVLSGIMTTFMNYCYAFTQNVGYPSYGVAIIMLTLIIKLVLAPLTAKQIRSMEGMQTLQPKIKELQKKYKGNQKKMQEEMTKLYRKWASTPCRAVCQSSFRCHSSSPFSMRFGNIPTTRPLKVSYGFPAWASRTPHISCRCCRLFRLTSSRTRCPVRR